MSIKMTFAQRNMLDRVIAAGEDGHPLNISIVNDCSCAR